jgi:hypothetical protein
LSLPAKGEDSDWEDFDWDIFAREKAAWEAQKIRYEFTTITDTWERIKIRVVPGKEPEIIEGGEEWLLYGKTIDDFYAAISRMAKELSADQPDARLQIKYNAVYHYPESYSEAMLKISDSEMIRMIGASAGPVVTSFRVLDD